ncbi:unnamed protein product [Sphagnum tenellum]
MEMDTQQKCQMRHRVLMVSDFFYPNFGGVENHIYYLSQCLLQRGHKVIVATHAYGKRSGVRYMTNGLKVYYIPRLPFIQQDVLPTLCGSLPILRTIFVLQFTLADVHQAICVSHTSKENTVLRSGLNPEKVFVIPNAVDTAMFRPDPSMRPCGTDEIVIVVISRLVYRKGADLLVEVIPEVCRLYPQVRFIVGGDGPKRVRLEEMREKHGLQDRVDMLGAVPHAEVRSVLVRGHIFLNSSLTEAFCIAILEAASCGLLTVSTLVGGVPEAGLLSFIPQVDPFSMHNRMKNLYSWMDVAKRTEVVYDQSLRSDDDDLLVRLSRYYACGPWAGKLFCLVVVINFIVWCFLEWQQPAKDLEVTPDLPPPQAFADELN